MLCVSVKLLESQWSVDFLANRGEQADKIAGVGPLVPVRLLGLLQMVEALTLPDTLVFSKSQQINLVLVFMPYWGQTYLASI